MFRETIFASYILLAIFSLAKAATINKIHKNSPFKVITLQDDQKWEQLDDQGKVLLAWTVHSETETITFDLEAETLGYVGFGISPSGSMSGADIFIAGVFENGTKYHSDRYGEGMSMPLIDNHPDWTLHEANEYIGHNYNRTVLKFSRALNTCDDQDYPIGLDTTRIIWSLGASDSITQHAERGTRSVNLLGAPMPDPDLTNIPEHKMTLSMNMPSEDTAYFCSFHRGPQLNNKTYHIIAFDAVLPDEKALAHTHHFILYNCYKDPLSNVSLEEIMGNKTVEQWNGDYCYRPSDPDMPKPPMKYCKEYLYVWAKGGKKMSFPDNVGYPIGNKVQADGDQFYMLEVHYDNPGKLENVHFETGVKFYYTENLRDEEAGLLMVGHDVSPALLIPPNTTEFVTAGHCGSLCTNSSFPVGGLKVFNVLLHSHISGRKLKLRHFRGEEELPWLDFDNQYDFDYQQNKHLNKEVSILPGDHFTFECTYSTLWKKGRAVIGDLSSEDEMCQAFMWHYPRIDRDLCGSTYDLELSLEDLGITNFTILETIGNPKIWINQPAELAGDFEDSLSTKYVWTENFKKELEETRRYKVHDGFCQSKVSKQNSLPNFPVEYPKIRQEYEPQDVCKTDSTSSGNVFVSFGVIMLSFLSLVVYYA